MNHWLLKSEPSTFGIDDLVARPGGVEPWDGVRNYQARNFLRDMAVGDRAFFYHSNCAEPGIVGLMRIARAAYPDDTAQDPANPHFDPRATPENPRWLRVDVAFERKFARPIALAGLKSCPELSGLVLLRKGNRLSVMPVGQAEWEFILALE